MMNTQMSGDGGGAPRAGGQLLPISWTGSPWSLTGLSFLNFFLSIITLGIYGFWGRTEVRRRIWSSVNLAGEPLAYTGTGKELFVGFLVVFGVLLIPTLILTIGAIVAFGQTGQVVAQIATAVVFAFLGGVAIYRARRYRLSRTNWRGIRGSLEGSSWAYGWTNFWTMMIVPLIALIVGGGLYLGFFRGLSAIEAQRVVAPYGVWIGAAYLAAIVLWLLLVPWRTTKLTRHITNEMAFGSRPFAFEGSARPLYLRFIARWIGVLVLAVATPGAIYLWLGAARSAAVMTPRLPGLPPGPPLALETSEVLGIIAILLAAFLLYTIITAWYKAVEANYFASVTSYEGNPFKLSVTAMGLIGLVLVNTLITIFSLGILRPVAMARTAKYFVENFSLDGPVDVRAIAQSQAAMSKSGEGLAQAFDVDAF
jgi:uncharacterized membrane protein YjgN (DUF898 family)